MGSYVANYVEHFVDVENIFDIEYVGKVYNNIYKESRKMKKGAGNGSRNDSDKNTQNLSQHQIRQMMFLL